METMKRLSPIGIGVSAIVAVGFFSVASTENSLEQSVAPGDSESSSIAIHRSRVIDAETGSIIHVSSLKRN